MCLAEPAFGALDDTPRLACIRDDCGAPGNPEGNREHQLEGLKLL